MWCRENAGECTGRYPVRPRKRLEFESKSTRWPGFVSSETSLYLKAASRPPGVESISGLVRNTYRRRGRVDGFHSCDDSAGNRTTPLLLLRGCDFGAIRCDERVYTQAHGQLSTAIQFDQSFQNLLVHALGGFVGANVLGTQLFSR